MACLRRGRSIRHWSMHRKTIAFTGCHVGVTWGCAACACYSCTWNCIPGPTPSGTVTAIIMPEGLCTDSVEPGLRNGKKRTRQSRVTSARQSGNQSTHGGVSWAGTGPAPSGQAKVMISGVFCGTNACVIDCADDIFTFTPVFAAPALRAHMHDFVLIRSRVL